MEILKKLSVLEVEKAERDAAKAAEESRLQAETEALAAKAAEEAVAKEAVKEASTPKRSTRKKAEPVETEEISQTM
jgi:hypothetical protein